MCLETVCAGMRTPSTNTGSTEYPKPPACIDGSPCCSSVCSGRSRRQSAVSEGAATMATILHHTTHANGIRQHYVEAGEGAPVVLLHGFPFTNYTWRYQIPELAKRYRVIAPDLRGYGETDKPVAGYDKRNMARDLRELLAGLD